MRRAKIPVVCGLKPAVNWGAVRVHFVEAEPSEKAYFEQALEGLDLEFVGALGHVEPGAEVVSIFVTDQLDAGFLAAHPALKLVATRSTSCDHIDLDALRARGVVVCHVPDYGETTAAEHTFALILALSRRLRAVMLAAKQPGRFSYEASQGFDLAGKTLGIIGMGRIGQRVLCLAVAFGMKVLAYDVDTPPELARSLGFEFVPLPQLLERSDVISLHAPLSRQTFQILNRDTLARCKRGVLIINTARGALIDTAALREALESGQVGGAGLDVLHDERILRDPVNRVIADDIIRHLRSDTMARESRDRQRIDELHELIQGDAVLQRPNVVFTPHLAFSSLESNLRRNQVTVENIRAFLAGAPIHRIA